MNKNQENSNYHLEPTGFSKQIHWPEHNFTSGKLSTEK